MLIETEIYNLVHNSGYKMSTLRYEDIDDKTRGKIPKPTWSDFTYFDKELFTFFEPISNKEITYKKFDLEEVYLDILRYQTKYDHLEIFDIPNGDSGKDLLSLINKYGWINWAEEKIDFAIYNHLEKYIKKNIDGHIEPDSLLDLETNQFIDGFKDAIELIDEWILLMKFITDQNNTHWDYSKFMGMAGFKEDSKINVIQPYSLGANLIFFHKLNMQKCSISECQICNDIFIQKRSTGIYCSNKCKVKNYKINKLKNI